MVDGTGNGFNGGVGRGLGDAGGERIVAAIRDRLEIGGDLGGGLVLAVDDLRCPGSSGPVVVDGAMTEIFEIGTVQGRGCLRAVDVAGGESVEYVVDGAHSIAASISRDSIARVVR